MPKRPTSRPRRIPQRTCVACRQSLPKRALLRLVRGPDGVRPDPTGKAAGRGAYLHNRRTCWERGLQGDLLERALRTRLTQAERVVLLEQLLLQIGQTMPDDDL